MTAVWADRIVSDDAINRCVSILRQVLSPQEKSAYIETLVRKGYISHFPAAPVVEAPVITPVRSRKLPLLAALAALAIIPIVLLIVFAGKSGHSTPDLVAPQNADTPMVAVLPFTFDKQSGESEFFANGMHNDLLTQLAKLHSLRVISSTSVQEYRGKEHNIRKIGEELGADVILEGSVQIAANQIHINAQLIDARTDEHLWAEIYDRDLSPVGIFDVQVEIAMAISEAMHATLTAQDSQQLALIPTENMAAYRAFHRAMQMREIDAGAPIGADYLRALEEAVELDPTFSRAWAELVTTLAYQNFADDKPELTLRAEEALRHLQALAPGSADLLFGQAAYVYYALKDYDRAHDIISRAITLVPSDAIALRLKSWIERRQGNFNEMVTTRREARRLDPRNPTLTDHVLSGLLVSHRYDEAWTEADTSALESFLIEYTRNVLLFREHRDFQRLQESMQETCEKYAEPDCGWDTHIANRDYAGALDSLDQPGDEKETSNVAESEQRLIFTHWLMGGDQFPQQKLQSIRDRLDIDNVDFDTYHRSELIITAALLAGLQGNVDEAEEWIQRWERQKPVDWAERSNSRHEACRILGMIEATHAAVECIEDGLKEASLMMPFMEPYLPYYDSLRGKPEFIEMLVEIEQGEAGSG